MKRLLPIVIFSVVFLVILFLNRRSNAKALHQDFNGIISSVYVCTKFTLCVKLQGSENEIYLGHYYLQQGDPIFVGDSLRKIRGSYKLEHYKINSMGNFELFDILDGKQRFK